MAKGSDFEREMSKALSKWWSNGERDDIFWRSAISGGRATQRAKQGKQTYGSYGDIAAVDPVGEPLLKAFTIELKCGQSHGCPHDLIEAKPSTATRPWEATMLQVLRSHQQAGSIGWMVISRRDRKPIMAYVDWFSSKKLGILEPPFAVYDMLINRHRVRFAAFQLRYLLDRLPPQTIIEYARNTWKKGLNLREA